MRTGTPTAISNNAADTSSVTGGNRFLTRTPMKSDSRSGQERRALRENWSAADVVALAGEIFKGTKHLDAVTQRARGKCVQCKIRVELKQVQIIVKLLATCASLECHRQQTRIRIARLKREQMTRNLRNPKALQSCISRKL